MIIAVSVRPPMWPELWAKIMPSMTSAMTIILEPLSSNIRRPSLSTRKIATIVAITFTTPTTDVARIALDALAKPACSKMVGA